MLSIERSIFKAPFVRFLCIGVFDRIVPNSASGPTSQNLCEKVFGMLAMHMCIYHQNLQQILALHKLFKIALFQIRSTFLLTASSIPYIPTFWFENRCHLAMIDLGVWWDFFISFKSIHLYLKDVSPNGRCIT